MRTRKPGQKKKTAPAPEPEVEEKQEQKSEPQPMGFTLRKGTYYEKGQKYKTGDTVKSFRDLCKVFKNKFDRITDPNALSEPLPEIRETGFRLLNKNAGMFDLLHVETGKVINKERISMQQAKELERAVSVPFADIPTEALDLLHQDILVMLEDGTLVK